MTLPTEFDWILVKRGDGNVDPGPEVFALICGVQDVTVNRQVNTTDRFVRDCAKPGETAIRKVKASGKQLDITGSGLTNADTMADFEASLGKVENYQIEGYQADGTDAGTLLGTFAGAFMMTAGNMSVPRDGEATSEITLANHGAWTWTPAP